MKPDFLDKFKFRKFGGRGAEEPSAPESILEIDDYETGEFPTLYACDWCGELFESSLYPQNCPQCGRTYTDYVEELDTGMMHGGRLVIREATERERDAYFQLRGKGEKRRIRTDERRRD